MADTPDLSEQGKYEILGKIKEGGMGAIYKVRHIHLDEVRIVKVIRPQIDSDPDVKKRFFQEAKLATSLKHPNIAAVLDFTADAQGNFFMVLEYIDGVNLNEYVARVGTPPLDAVLDLSIQTLSALEFLHDRGVVHRDISPDNIMLARGPNGEAVVKIIDLGVAKVEAGEGLTQSGMFVGKLKYGSPEQLGQLEKGEKLDGRSDLYSFACVLYHLVTGQFPYTVQSSHGYFAAHLMNKPTPFEDSDSAGRVPPDLRAAILKGLEKNRKDRWANARELSAELKRIRTGLAGSAAPFVVDSGLIEAAKRMHPPAKPSKTASEEAVNKAFSATPTGTPRSVPKSAGFREARTVLETADDAAPEKAPEKVVTPPPRPRTPGPVAKVQLEAGRARPRFALVASILVAAIGGVVVILLLRPRGPGGAGGGKEGTPTPTASPMPSKAPIVAPTVARPTTVPTAARTLPPPPTQQPPKATVRLVPPTVPPTQVPTKAATATKIPPRVPTATSPPVKPPATQTPVSPTATRPPIAASPTPQPRPTSTPVPARPSPTPEPPAPTATRPTTPQHPTEPPPAGPEEGVRAALEQFRRAQSTLDVELYATVYPALSEDQKQQIRGAFADMSSQTVSLEVLSIKVAGSTAVARCAEQRTVVFKAGKQVKGSREAVYKLEKRGARWVITTLG